MEEILDLERAEEIIDEDSRLCGISGDGDIFNDHAAVDALRLHRRLRGQIRKENIRSADHGVVSRISVHGGLFVKDCFEPNDIRINDGFEIVAQQKFYRKLNKNSGINRIELLFWGFRCRC